MLSQNQGLSLKNLAVVASALEPTLGNARQTSLMDSLRYPLLMLFASMLAGCSSAGRRIWQDRESPGFSATEPVIAEEDEIARELANPTSTLGKMTFNFDHVEYDGDRPNAGRQDSNVLLFQPSLPYPLETGLSLFVRPAIPIIFDQPVFNGTGFDDEGVELGDIGFDVGYGGQVDDSGLILLGGIVGTAPTATQDDVGKHQWSVGPELLIGHLQEWGAVGFLVTHQWNVVSTSSSADNVNVTGGQYFYTYLLPDGWAIGSDPQWSYDWDADGGDRLTLPLGTGISRTVIFGRTPWKFALEGAYYIESPDAFGPDWSVRLSVTPVVSLPW